MRVQIKTPSVAALVALAIPGLVLFLMFLFGKSAPFGGQEARQYVSRSVDKNTAGFEVSFSSYPAKLVYTDSFAVTLDFNGPTLREYRKYRTFLRNEVKDGRPNMGGHYKLVAIPCGSPCRFFLLVDLKSQRVIKLPSETIGFLNATSRADSRLLKLSLLDLRNAGACQYLFYEWLEQEQIFRSLTHGSVAGVC